MVLPPSILTAHTQQCRLSDQAESLFRSYPSDRDISCFFHFEGVGGFECSRSLQCEILEQVTILTAGFPYACLLDDQTFTGALYTEQNIAP
jgi:hypothetical protein